MGDVMNGDDRFDTGRQKKRQVMTGAPEKVDTFFSSNNRYTQLHPQGAQKPQGRSALNFRPFPVIKCQVDESIGE